MKRPTDGELAQACSLAEEIASTASRADQFCSYFSPQPGNVRSHEVQINMLREAIRRMGWLADLCATKLGGAPLQGDAEAWMTSPDYLSHGRGDA